MEKHEIKGFKSITLPLYLIHAQQKSALYDGKLAILILFSSKSNIQVYHYNEFLCTIIVSNHLSEFLCYSRNNALQYPLHEKKEKMRMEIRKFASMALI